MKKTIAVFGIATAFVVSAPSAEALSCLQVDMYLESVMNDEATQIFIGTATAAKDHAQVVTVTEALQGWIAPKVWVIHPWSKDWQYFCSNGPAAAGKPTIFFTTIDEFGSRSVVQTLEADSELGKAFLADVQKENPDAGITEATAAERASEMMQSISDLIGKLMNMLRELAFWEKEAK